MSEIWTVTQVDWSQHEYAVTVHDDFTTAWETLTTIYNDRKSNGQLAEIIEREFISGEGWEARIEYHRGDEHADVHWHGVSKD
jgi:hypothetical protein